MDEIPYEKLPGDFLGGTVVKNLPAGAGDAGDLSSIPSQEDTLEEEMATHSSILAWEIPWTEEPGGLQSMGSQRVTEHTRMESYPAWAVMCCVIFSEKDFSRPHSSTHCTQRPMWEQDFLNIKKIFF